MQEELKIVQDVYAAKQDPDRADSLVREYVPFIRTQAAKFLKRICTEQDDEYSIAMIAFYEAILHYEKERGAFLSYASLLIRNRLIDYSRKETKHKGHLSLHEENGEEDDRTLADTISDENDEIDALETREATRREIEELSAVMQRFGISFSDVADNCPKQARTLQSCAAAIRFAKENKDVLDELLRTQKLPMNRLVSGTGVERKTMERHRKYLLAMLLIQTNGFEIIRGHLHRVLNRRDGAEK